MSAQGATPPIFELTCDQPGCVKVFRAQGWFVEAKYIRPLAFAEGWRVRPLGGVGSRSASDFCPDHAA